jgi:hypothetical protein
MLFRSVADLERAIWSALHRFPQEADAVIGIPRSGMLAASFVALALNLPLGEVAGFAEGRLLGSGRRATRRTGTEGPPRTVILVDDSVYSGEAIAKARAHLLDRRPEIAVVTCAVFASAESEALVDLALEVLPAGPRVFQWNVMHHPVLESACVDIDGVLCVDPTPAENDDGAAYRRFLLTAAPLFLPSRRIGTLVTSRLEKYRAETEQWLARHGIAYDRLEMMDLPDAALRRQLGNHGVFKAGCYRAGDAVLFIESDRGQAIEIAQISGKPVLWIGGPCLIDPARDLDVALRESVLRIGRGVRARLKSTLIRTVGPSGVRRLKALRRTFAPR